jgi:hypothetical protein
VHNASLNDGLRLIPKTYLDFKLSGGPGKDAESWQSQMVSSLVQGDQLVSTLIKDCKGIDQERGPDSQTELYELDIPPAAEILETLPDIGQIVNPKIAPTRVHTLAGKQGSRQLVFAVLSETDIPPYRGEW